MRVVVSGMGILSAAGSGVEAFAQAIEEGRPGDRSASHLLGPEAQRKIGATIQEAEYQSSSDPLDPAFRMAARALGEALESANLDASALPEDCALLVGTSLGGAVAAQSWHQDLLHHKSPRRDDILQAPLHALTDWLGSHFHVRGPRSTLSNACVSGTNAVGMALDMIRSGECDVALAGGVDSLHDFNFSGFATLWSLTSERCRPFDASRTGMLLGEAAAFLVLESEDHALKRLNGRPPLAELAGYGSSGDAVHITAPDREGGGAYRSIRMAFEDAGVSAEEIDFVSLHGTGTMYADAMETAAMGRIFGERVSEVPATSLRPVTGHTLGSAGSVDSIACVVALNRDFVPPTPNHQELDPALPSPIRVITEVLRGPIEVALNTSSGFAGSNASVIFRKWSART
jgi:3-oxoacyl-[acyl-carrier-protein] synthase II